MSKYPGELRVTNEGSIFGFFRHLDLFLYRGVERRGGTGTKRVSSDFLRTVFLQRERTRNFVFTGIES